MSGKPPVRRDTARLIVRDPEGRVLLFRFTPDNRAPFWATPGGAVDPGETHAQAARRELMEETGFDCDPGAAIAMREVRYHAFWGDEVISEEHYFAVSVPHAEIDTSGHEEIERAVMTSHAWFDRAMLRGWHETIFPDDVAELLDSMEHALKDA